MLRIEKYLGSRAFAKLKKKKVFIIGVGGTGSSAAELLARAGVSLVLIDRDVVEETNLDRQTLFTKKDIGRSKAICAKEKLSEFCAVEAKFEDIDNKNISSFGLSSADLIIDCSDNVETRLLLNDYCRQKKIPWIHTAAVGSVASVFFVSVDGPCYYCLNEDKYGETCEQAGVLNTATAIAGIIAANLAINYLAKDIVEKDLIRISLFDNTFLKLKVNKNKRCPACSGNHLWLSGQNTKEFIKLCGNGKYSINAGKKIDLQKLAKTFPDAKKTKDAIISKDFLVLSNGRVVVTAKDKTDARKKYDQYIGV